MTESQFKVGDTVYLVNKNGSRRTFGIPDKYWGYGMPYVVTHGPYGATGILGDDEIRYSIRSKDILHIAWCAIDDMLDAENGPW